jgi:hypothetical protein
MISVKKLSMEFAVCDQYKERRADVSFQLAFSRLELFANRLWQPSEPDVVDVVYGRIWLHSLELEHRLNCTTVADALAGIDFCDAGTKNVSNTSYCRFEKFYVDQECIVSVPFYHCISP